MEFVDAMCEKYQLSSDEVDRILVNFLNYVMEFKVDDIRDFLTFRKSTYKARIKESCLKNRLRDGIDNKVKNPVKLLSRLLSDDYVYRKFMKSLRKTQPEIKPTVSANTRCRASNWTSDELQQLQTNIEKICQTHEINDWKRFVLDSSKQTMAFKKRINFYSQLTEELPGRSYQQISGRCHYEANKIPNQKWTLESTKELESLIDQHGHNWVLIGKKLNKSPISCQSKFCRIIVKPGFERNVGKWDRSECKRLRKAIRKIMNVPRKTMIYKSKKLKLIGI
ncbi:Replication termination factor 1 [Thelohanellus kitauei]|uniref:Replication termination factor 1 n=1 Tax=Thelohanellus kitauei TaxID=669202 RepID=A0A0C2MX10_THEKT|nr:Replication termination factor 1 [Thelohanellus kitauei]